jgi:hypothetical protein
MTMNKERLVAALEQKISKDVGHRVDLQIEDVRKINNSTAHFMVAYVGEQVPSSEQLAEMFVRKFNAKIHPILSTARVYKSEQVVTVVASLLSLTRAIDDAKQLTPVIEGAVYLDVPLQETWEVAERGGQRVLVRKVKDDIMAIVQARRNSMLESQSGKKSFAALSTAGNDQLALYLAMLEKGDRVKVYMDDKIVDAEVVSSDEGEVKVKHKGGLSTLPRHAVLEVCGRNPAEDEKVKKEAQDYYTDAYGDPGYARELTRKLN